jgi:hypothetical protein
MSSLVPCLNVLVTQLRRLFARLQPPEAGQLNGFFRARFVGPFWMRWSGPSTLSLTGLPGWQGKRFLGNAQATNVLKVKGQEREALRMTVVPGQSLVDGKAGIALHYGTEAPRPWRWVRDELRVIDENTILGITIVDAPVIRHFRFPFVLERAS